MRLRPGAGSPVLAVLKDSDFRVLWYVGTLGEISRRMEQLVLSWLVLLTTDSPFMLGLVLVFLNLPRPLFSLFSGLIADSLSRRRVLAVAQAINLLVAAGLLALIFLGIIATWQVFLAVFLQGVTKSLEDPSRRTAILDIVGERRLVNALSLDMVSNTAGKMLGPILGGVLVDTIDFRGAYLLVVAVHVVTLALVLLRVRIPASRRTPVAEPVWRSLGMGVRTALHNPMLMGMLYITIVMNALAFPAQQFIPAIGRDFLGVGASLVGLLAAAEGLGQLLGAGVVATTRDLRHHGRVFVLGSALVLVMVMLFVWSPWYALAFVLLTAGGMGQAGFSTMQSSITLLEAPPEMRGRMMGLLSVCIGMGTPLGTLEIGAIAAAFSTQWAISANALVGLVLLVPALFLTPLALRPSSHLSREVAPSTAAAEAERPSTAVGD